MGTTASTKNRPRKKSKAGNNGGATSTYKGGGGATSKKGGRSGGLNMAISNRQLRRLSLSHAKAQEKDGSTSRRMHGLSRDDLDIPRDLSALRLAEAQRYSPPLRHRKDSTLRLRLHSIDHGSLAPADSRGRRSIQLDNFRKFRNLSSMDEEMLQSIAHESEIDKGAQPRKPAPVRAQKRRVNSTNCLFVDQTLTNITDTDSIISSISAVMHKLIDNGPGRCTPKYQVFNSTKCKATTKPTYERVFSFMRHIFTRAQLEPECIITAHIFMEKLMKNLSSQLTVGYLNWEAIVLACFMLASKVLDDLSMINADFSYICSKYNFELKQVNKMEIALLSALKFDVRVSLSRYAQYYFKLRGMHNYTPYAVGAKATSDGSAAPLSVEGAMNLQTLSNSYSDKLKTKMQVFRPRFNTIGGTKGLSTRKANKAKLPNASVDQMLVSSRSKESL